MNKILISIAALALASCAMPLSMETAQRPANGLLTVETASLCVAEHFGVEPISQMPVVIVTSRQEIIDNTDSRVKAKMAKLGQSPTGEALTYGSGWLYIANDLTPERWNTVLTHEWVHAYHVERLGYGVSMGDVERELHAQSNEESWRTCSLFGSGS